MKDFLATRLQGARRYDRIAGFFSSSLLEVAGEALERMTPEGGDYERMVEHLLPTGLTGPVRAYREHRRGVTTQAAKRMWGEDGKPSRNTHQQKFILCANNRVPKS